MLRKWEVPIRELSIWMINILDLIDKAFIEVTGFEATCTSTYTDSHSISGRHYYKDFGALDFRLKYFDLPTRDDIRLAVKKKIREKYPNRKYDVVFSGKRDSILHIEYDPKPKEV